MKLFLHTAVLLSLFVSAANAQYRFKTASHPGKTYVANMHTDADMIMDFEADEATLNSIKSSGLELPMKVKSVSDKTVTSVLAKKTINGKLPFVMTFDKSSTVATMSGREMAQADPMNGLVLYGHLDEQGKYHTDSVANGPGPEFKAMMDKVIDQFQVQTIFPERPLKIGDEFTDERPMDLPIAGGATMKMVIKSKYKLIKVEGDIATFDLIQDLTLALDMGEKGDAQLTGSGKGIMKFNMKDQYASNYDTNVDMKMKMKIKEMFMTMSGVTVTKMETTMK
jgi:hypothetical protein